MSYFTTQTVSLKYVAISDTDCPYNVSNLVCLNVTLSSNQVIKIDSSVNYAIIRVIFSGSSSRSLHILPPTGTTINSQSFYDMTINGQSLILARSIGGNNYMLLVSAVTSIPVISSSTNNAIVRVGSIPGTVADSTTLIDNTGNVLTTNNYSVKDVKNNGVYFYANINAGVGLGSSFQSNNNATVIGINSVQSVPNVSSLLLGYNCVNNSQNVATSSTSMIIGSSGNPNLTAGVQAADIVIGYNVWQSANILTITAMIGNNISNIAGATTINRPLFIGQNLYNDATTVTSSLVIGRNFTKTLQSSVIIGSNIAANTGTLNLGGIIIGHNSVTDGTNSRSGLTAIGTSCAVDLSNSITCGYGIGTKGVNTADVICIGSTAGASAAAITGARITAIGYGSSPIISGSDIVAVGSGTNGVGTTTLFAVGYQAANTSTATNCAMLGFQAGQTGNITNSAAIGYQALNAGAQSCAVIGASAGKLVTGSGNCIMGYNAAATLTTGTNNIIVGSGADVSASGRVNAIAIGKDALSQTDNGFALGSAGTPLTTQTTIGAAGGASALPATPLTYLFVRLNGTLLRTPLYN